MASKTRTAIRRSLAALLLATMAGLAGCGADDSQKSCKGCRINGSFYETCPDDPEAYCAWGQPCSISLNVCK